MKFCDFRTQEKRFETFQTSIKGFGICCFGGFKPYHGSLATDDYDVVDDDDDDDDAVDVVGDVDDAVDVADADGVDDDVDDDDGDDVYS